MPSRNVALQLINVGRPLMFAVAPNAGRAVAIHSFFAPAVKKCRLNASAATKNRF
jgi:hypothetical protein